MNHLSLTAPYTICLFNIAMENPKKSWRFLAGKIIYFYGPWLPWPNGKLLSLRRVNSNGDFPIKNGDFP